MGKSRYTLRVDEEELDRWNDAVEESDTEYASLRHLIQLAVTRELSDSYILREDIEGLEVDVSTSVENGIEELRTEMSELREDFKSFEITQSHDPEQVADLAASIHSLIPVVERDNQNEWLQNPVQDIRQMTDEEAIRSYGRVRDIVEYMEESGSIIRNAVAKLEYDMDDVHSRVDAAGAQRVYKVVDDLSEGNSAS